MTLTREQLKKTATRRCELVKGVDGFGDVWVRSVSEFQRSRRMSSLFDAAGNVDTNAKAKRRAHMIVDQVMATQDQPMFTDADVDMLLELDGAKLDPLVEAITVFNGDDEKKDTAGLKDSNAN